MSDRYYGPVFALPYWEYLDFPGLEAADREFIRDGSLVMLLATAFDIIDGSGGHIYPHISACQAALARLDCQDEDTLKLVKWVRLALAIAERGCVRGIRTYRSIVMGSQAICSGYFRRIADGFDNNPYFGRGGREPA